MSTTTFPALRLLQINAINALTPSSMASTPFKQNLAEREFREWATTTGGAAFRRYSIEDLMTDELPTISNGDVEELHRELEVVVAYPHDHRYGGDNLRDMRDIMDEDYFSIDDKIGHRGYELYTATGAAALQSKAHEDLDTMSFLVLTYDIWFHRAV